jgi:hypothetical protein
MAQPIEADRMPEDRQAAGGPFPYQIAPPSAVRRRRLGLFLLAGIVTYIVVLAATLPARLLLQRAGEPGIWLAVGGTVWNGEAALGQGHSVTWRWSPLASLANFKFMTKVRVTGAATELNGTVAWSRGGVRITDLDGDASASLITALAPSLPFVCDFPMRVNIDHVSFGSDQPGAAGEIRSSAGSCVSRNSAVSSSTFVPPLIARAASNLGGSNGWVAPMGNRLTRLISFSVTAGGDTSVTVDPAAAAVIPGADAIRALAE